MEVPVQSIQTDDGEFIRDDFRGKVSTSFKCMQFIFRNHITPQRSIRTRLIIRSRRKDIMSISVTHCENVRPDIIVPVTWNDWNSEGIQRIIAFKNLVEFIAHGFI